LFAKNLSAEYYQRKHEESPGYQTNNWLMAEEERLMSCNPETIVEVGCGNARFLRHIAPRVKSAIGLDWAISPLAVDLPANVKIERADVVGADLPKADLVCSADVLEHFSPQDIGDVLLKLHAAGRFNYHVIACYKTASHLSIFAPDEWLTKFRGLSADYTLKQVFERKSKRGAKPKNVCVIANY